MHRALLFPVVLLCGCVPTPDSYPVPPQHTPVTAPEPTQLHSFVTMADPRAEAFLVSGVGALEGRQWRWTTDDAHLRFHVLQAKGMDALLEFSITDITFAQTGPLRLEVLVNRQPLGKQVFPSPGEKMLRLPVPASMLKQDADNDLELQVENPWIAPADHAKLGVLLRAAGFVPHN